MTKLDRLRDSGLLEPATAAVVIAAVLLVLDLRFWDRSYWSELLVDVHGMLLELAVLGCILLWFERRRERRESIAEIRTHLEGIRLADDARSLAVKCALLKQLSDQGLPAGYLFAIRLEKQHLPGINWSKAQIASSHLSGSMLDNAVLEGCRRPQCRPESLLPTV